MATRKSSKSATSAAADAAAIAFTGLSAKEFGSLRAAKQAISAQLLKPTQTRGFSALAASTNPAPSSNLVGVGIGEKLSGDKHTGIMAVKFLVRIKYPDNQVPEADRLPSEVDGHPVDVEQVGTFRRFATPATQMPNPRTTIKPAQPGCSVGFQVPGNAFIMAGTYGALVKRGQKRFILSNNHVLADENQLAIGAPIFQPGFLDAGTPPHNRVVARLAAFIPLDVNAPNLVDCAIAELTSNSAATNSILFIGPPKGKTRAQIDMVVHKFGRTTGFTVGRVTSIETDTTVQYEMGVATFTDQIIIVGLNANPFSASGDSGSLILERNSNKAVGLLFAGSPTHTIANHIAEVLTALKVRLITN